MEEHHGSRRWIYAAIKVHFWSKVNSSDYENRTCSKRAKTASVTWFLNRKCSILFM